MRRNDAGLSRDELRSRLLDWYRENARDLPWRDTTDPYEVLVSEVMLHQTPVRRVEPKWGSFLEAFPTAEDLADAPLREVLALWDGLGYNRRARYLKRCAEMVVERGSFPRTPEGLRELPGVGPYTAHAVASFAFGSGGPVFDTNVRRLLYRRRGGAPDPELRAHHEALFPPDQSRAWNNAVMELGSLVCTSGRPRCGDCPWRPGCVARNRTDFSTPAVPKQPGFEGSWRQARAGVLKLLLDGPLRRDELQEDLDLPEAHDLDELLEELSGEGLVEERGERYGLPE